MKKVMILVLAMMVFATMAMAQIYTLGNAGGIHNIDKLGAHQNGGRGCVGCHAPHSGARGNGGTFAWDPTANAGAGAFNTVSTAIAGNSGEEVLWGQDLEPLYGKTLNFPSGDLLLTKTGMPERIKTGVVMCLSCHDGNVAKGAMMTNVAFEKQFLTNAKYGTLDIPTLLGNDGGTAGNYKNDHPVGPAASIATINHGNSTTWFKVTGAVGSEKVVTDQVVQPAWITYKANYGLPLLDGARAGAGFAVDETTPTDVSKAYVVCTSCHTPHSMHVTTSSATNPIAGTGAGGVFPTYFFIAAPYNPVPAAFPTDGSKASSATQFCRQCHFGGAGGANEASGITTVTTAF